MDDIPKLRLKRYLAKKRSSGSKPIINDDENKGEQPVESVVIVKEQREQENSKKEKTKMWPKCVEPWYL